MKFSNKGNFCSAKCRNKNIDKITKQVKTYKNSILTNENRNEIIIQSNKKREETCLRKYGCKTNLQITENKEKSKETCLKKYGVEFPSQNDEIRKKQLISYKETMNVHHDEIISKFKNTIKEKYNGNYIWNSTEKRNFSRLHDLWETILSYNEYIEPLFTERDLNHLRSGKIYKWKCRKCGKEFESHIHKTMHISKFPYLPRCLNCFPFISGFSNEEIELFKFIKEIFPNAHKDKTIIYPYELDIVIDEIKLAIEFNGCYFHSIEINTKSGYHLNKTLKCESKGFRLIQIWEDDWVNNKEEIKLKLLSIFKNEENLNFNEDLIKLDRCWYSKLQTIPGYILIEETKPEIVETVKNLHIENCGYLILKKMKKF